MAELTFWEKVFLFLIRYPFCWFVLLENALFTIFFWVKELISAWSRTDSDLRDKEVADLRRKRHGEKVEFVQKQVKDWNESEKGKTRMCCGRPPWQQLSFKNPAYKSTMTRIDLSALNEILALNAEGKILTVEPSVSMGQISKALLPLGWTLAVLPELEELTVGGMVNGFGIESSSHKYGLFQSICEGFELVMPNGEVINCTRNDNPDLFHSIPWSCGTIAFLTAVKLRIIPAQAFVRVTYCPVQTLDGALKQFEFEAKRTGENQFVEGLLFSPTEAVIMTGNFVESPDEVKNINRISRWYKPWFFKHVQGFLGRDKAEGPFVEYIPTRDYYHRHSRSSFWEQPYVIPFGNNVIFRFLFGWLLPLKLQYLKLFSAAWMRDIMMKMHMVEDFLVPINRLKEFLIFADNETGIYPVWLCGAAQELRNPRDPRGLVGHFDRNTPLYVDVGLYGDVRTSLEEEDVAAKIYRMEICALKMKGYKALYADAVVNKEEFRQMYCHELYDVMREQYGGNDAFPQMYDKVKLGTRK